VEIIAISTSSSWAMMDDGLGRLTGRELKYDDGTWYETLDSQKTSLTFSVVVSFCDLCADEGQRQITATIDHSVLSFQNV
jgi:hypothetical protein